MFPSCSGPDNQRMTRQGDEGRGSYDSGPHPHSWPQFCNPWPSSGVHHSRSQSPYGGAYVRAQTPYWRKHPNTWQVRGRNSLLQYTVTTVSLDRRQQDEQAVGAGVVFQYVL